MHLNDYREQFFPTPSSQQPSYFKEDRKTLISFFFALSIYIIYMLYVQPHWLLDGEMWAEMATNYYPNANAPSLFQKLFSTDAGYIPAPQRIIALIGNQLNLSAAIIPYYYTWSGILLTGLLVCSFCLPQFRKLVKSDSLRFFTSITILLVADFETRTFINFTYFSAFFVAIITALALVDNSDEVPWWAWFTPILMISKPAVLAVLPIMFLVAFVSKSRFRWIVIVTIILCFGQFIQMLVSSTTDTTPFQPTDITLVSKLLATVLYFLGFLGGYITGHSLSLHHFILITIGLFVLFLIGHTITKKRSSSNALIIVGISILFFNILLNTFALSSSWNTDLNILPHVPVYRHIIVGFFGCILITCGLICTLTNNNFSNSSSLFKDRVATLIFILWLIISDWLAYGKQISKEPNAPTLNSSQWQIMSDSIDADVSHICVPINPWSNWMYKKGCDLLNSAPSWENGSYKMEKNFIYNIAPPASLKNKTLVSVAILLKSEKSDFQNVNVKMQIQLKNGSVKNLSNSKKVNHHGGLLLLSSDTTPINDIANITLKFDIPVEAALDLHQPSNLPGLAWMGF
ncbi:hypothetical protein [Acinetobacter faecalis]|uniref:hypothetical protein n=1 Tax=Acinetobacter faecalis TaxID=2665161 RepID=UPI002A90E940|nr:hypothetical protein [Acinetobacter faecalis]MDY6484284.1 hypothetical protein [Acinetobacter faecalis]